MSAPTLPRTASPRRRTALEIARRAEHIAAMLEGDRAARRAGRLLKQRLA